MLLASLYFGMLFSNWGMMLTFEKEDLATYIAVVSDIYILFNLLTDFVTCLGR